MRPLFFIKHEKERQLAQLVFAELEKSMWSRILQSANREVCRQERAP